MCSAQWFRKLESITVVLLLGLISGCASVNLVDWKRFRVPKASAKDPVTCIVSIWEAAEGQGLDGKPTRGFAGQILFFTHGKASPVGVDGDVTIELFDGPANSVESTDPIHRFDFVGDAWTIHLTESVLGASYNVFIPYTRKHSWRASCGLRVQLKSSLGTTAYSELVHITLPGPVPKATPQPAPLGPSRPVGVDQARAEIQIGASLQRRTIKPVTYESNAAPAQKLPSPAEAVSTADFAPPASAGRPQDKVFQQHLQQLEAMLNELKQQQQTSSPTSQPAAPDRPKGRRFELQPARATADHSTPEPVATHTTHIPDP